MKRVRVSITGRVQGVFFRTECERMARGLGLAGFVRNLPDGSVEAVFEGPDLDIDAAVEWCAQGPPLAAIDSVVGKPEPPVGETGFTIR